MSALSPNYADAAWSTAVVCPAVDLVIVVLLKETMFDLVPPFFRIDYCLAGTASTLRVPFLLKVLYGLLTIELFSLSWERLEFMEDDKSEQSSVLTYGDIVWKQLTMSV